jgi:SAM-dependent methyltransferase
MGDRVGPMQFEERRNTMQSSVTTASSAGLHDDLVEEAGQYWRQSAVRPWVQDMSHWRGQGRWADDGEWKNVGAKHVELYRQLCVLSGRETPVRSMLEWGPGGGANAVAFAQQVARFYGVDISPANLRECARQLEAIAYKTFRPIEIDASTPEQCLESIDAPVDFVLCTAVFQHFPGNTYGERVMRVFHRALADDGIALVQTRYDDGSEALRCKSSDYAKNVVAFTSYRVEEFWRVAVEAGFEPISVVLCPEQCYAFYMLKKAQARE